METKNTKQSGTKKAAANIEKTEPVKIHGNFTQAEIDFINENLKRFFSKRLEETGFKPCTIKSLTKDAKIEYKDLIAKEKTRAIDLIIPLLSSSDEDIRNKAVADLSEINSSHATEDAKILLPIKGKYGLEFIIELIEYFKAVPKESILKYAKDAAEAGSEAKRILTYYEETGIIVPASIKAEAAAKKVESDESDESDEDQK